jgi:c-di-GMP-binding flagellar brake protein YcgR/Tfp pilus assembly protein PilZ
MERRGSDRIRRRISCAFEHEGERRDALVVDLSAGGLFLQTDAALPLGSELRLCLRPEGLGELELRGRVARRRFTPAVISSLLRRGVGIQLLAAPESYRELLGGAGGAPDAAWSALSDLEPPFEPPCAGGDVSLDIAVAAEPSAVEEPTLELRHAPPAAEAADEEEEEEETPAKLPTESAPVPEAPGWAPESRCRADALLIHDGELDDVQALLEAMGADAVCQPTIEPSGFADWESPPRLIVASGRSALRLSIGTNVEGQGIVTIAVVDSESQTLCGMLRRQGFRYVVRRPVHHEALRLLLGRALFRGRERRDAARISLGCEVGLRFGLRRKPATLLELSRTGCRVLIPEWVEPGARLSVRIPTAVTGNRPLSLVGRVVRSERQRRASSEPNVAVALRFDRLDAETRARLDALIAAHTLGPTPLDRKGGVARPASAATAPFGGVSDRRRSPRVPHRREVIALEPELSRVRHTLLGIDLSLGGIRVEPHPELALGDRVRIAIYDSASNASLVVDAEAVRDQGAQGVVLRFENVPDDARRQIERILAAPPQIESAGAAAGSGVVVAEMLEQQTV